MSSIRVAAILNVVPHYRQRFWECVHERDLWMYDEKTLTFELERVGFMKIRRCVFGDAQIPEFSEVEDRGRFENCLAIECFK